MSVSGTLFDVKDDAVVPIDRWSANRLLAQWHYLGPIQRSRLCLGHFDSHELVQCQVWVLPTSRHLPSDGSCLELARWCITPMERTNGGSWFNARAVRLIRQTWPEVNTLVSYSELGHHSGGLYRASNWEPWPTHHADRFMADGIGYASGHGSWDGVNIQAPKFRWRIRLNRGKA